MLEEEYLNQESHDFALGVKCSRLSSVLLHGEVRGLTGRTVMYPSAHQSQKESCS